MLTLRPKCIVRSFYTTIVSNIVISFKFFFIFSIRSLSLSFSQFSAILLKSLTKNKQINKMEHEFYNIYECFNALVC